jgi:hypothetical protein
MAWCSVSPGIVLFALLFFFVIFSCNQKKKLKKIVPKKKTLKKTSTPVKNNFNKIQIKNAIQ